MSRSYDEQSRWYYSSTTSPEHDRYVRDHHHHIFHPPPPLPPLPSHMGGQAAPIPGPGGGFHQGFAVPPHWVQAPPWTVASPEYRGGPYFGETPSLLGVGSGSSESSTSASSSSSSAAAAGGGGRPVPAKSAFMCFCEAKGAEISDRNEATLCTQETSGVVEAMAAEWRRLPLQEKAYWEGIATNEKTRFAKERDALCKAHKGPLARKLRAKKDPLAPKRPMSAFLMYAQHRRRQLQRENPDVPNSDISRLLGELWRGTGAAEKRPFLEREEAERRMYKAKMEKWKNDQKLERSMKSSSTKEPRGMMPDRRQDVSSSAQEETHPRYGPSEQSSNSTAYSTRSTLIHHSRQYKEIHTDNEVDVSPPRHQYNYDIGSWMPMYNQEEVHLKYTYPRPREDRPQS